MMTPEFILSVTKDPVECSQLARADKALLTLEGDNVAIDRILDFFTGYARGYEEALAAVRKGEVKICGLTR
ncbi:MAG: hypothetical protein IJ080_07755 [Oscillospiraceae bacterium]|nr:hypothetical protein [Oscillospiraceae bacterium]